MISNKELLVGFVLACLFWCFDYFLGGNILAYVFISAIGLTYIAMVLPKRFKMISGCSLPGIFASISIFSSSLLFGSQILFSK